MIIEIINADRSMIAMHHAISKLIALRCSVSILRELYVGVREPHFTTNEGTLRSLHRQQIDKFNDEK